MRNFVQHKATKIQAHIRGHLSRQALQPSRPASVDKIAALVKGWKIRKILALREMKTRSGQIKDLTDELALSTGVYSLKIHNQLTCCKHAFLRLLTRLE